MERTEARARQAGVVWEVESEDESENRIRAAARSLAQRLKAGEVHLPMLPAAAAEALRLAQNPATSMQELERAVHNDPLVAMRVVAVANSAIYGNHCVRTLGQALIRLGTGTIRDILYQAVAESHIFQGSSVAALTAEKDHAIAVAHIARALCKLLGIDGEYAFLCGLLHDIGRVALLDMLTDDTSPLTGRELTQLVARMHAAVGTHVAVAWKLPKLVPEACRRHHIYRQQPTMPYSQIGNVIAAADRIALHHGAGRHQRTVAPEGEPVFYDLGLEADAVLGLIESVYPAVAEACNGQPSPEVSAEQSGVFAPEPPVRDRPANERSGGSARASLSGLFRRKAS